MDFSINAWQCFLGNLQWEVDTQHPVELCNLSVEMNDQSMKVLAQSKLEVAYFHAPSNTI